jgi:hypothetical protein
MLMKGLDDILFTVATTRFVPSYYGAKAVPQLPRKCKGSVRRRHGRRLEAVARYYTGI